jgi:hypothetical protein
VGGPQQAHTSEVDQGEDKSASGSEMPGGLTGALLQLQRKAGNAAVTKLVQNHASKPVDIKRGGGLHFALAPVVVAGRTLEVTGKFGIKGRAEGDDLPKTGVEQVVRERAEPLMRNVAPRVEGGNVHADVSGAPLDVAVTRHGPQPVTMVAYLAPKSVALSLGSITVTGAVDAEIVLQVGPDNTAEPSKGDSDRGPLAGASFGGAKAVLDNVTNDKGKGIESKNVAAAQTAHLKLPSGTPPEVARELDTPVKLLRWLEFMRPWFGSDAATTDHFAHIGKVDGQDGMMLHDDARTRLEAVQRRLGKGNYPRSSVGWSFRGEIQVGQEQRHKHMHKIGYAADFDATNLPMLTDARTKMLIALTTGRSHHIEMGRGPDGSNWDEYQKRREMISSMGAHTADSADQDAFLERLGQQMDQLAAASDRFKSSIGDEGKLAFVKLRDQWWGLVAAHKPGSKEFDKGKADIQANLGSVLSPWIDKIDAKRAQLLEKASKAGVDLAAAAPDPGQVIAINKALKPVQALAKVLTKKPDSKVSRTDLASLNRLGALLGRPALEDFPGAAGVSELLDLAKGKLEGLQERLAVEKGLSVEREAYSLAGQLRSSLLNDLNYVFGRSTEKVDKKSGVRTRQQKLEVMDPSASQLLDHGYFRMADDTTDESQRSKRISKEFAREMVQSGFEMGGAWGSSDAMHFEIAVGPTPAQVKAHDKGPSGGHDKSPSGGGAPGGG